MSNARNLANIISGGFTADDIPSLDASKITTGTITPSDNTVTNAKIVDSTIQLAKLSATGTKDATTFLRGDNTFAEAGGGKVLQVVETAGISGDQTTTSSTFSDISGASMSITPSSTSSKILLLLNTNTFQTIALSYWKLRWKRTVGGTDTTFGDSSYGLSHARAAVNSDFWGGVGMTYLDSPNTTSAITYTVQIAADGGTASFGVNNTPSYIIAMEIGA